MSLHEITIQFILDCVMIATNMSHWTVGLMEQSLALYSREVVPTVTKYYVISYICSLYYVNGEKSDLYYSNKTYLVWSELIISTHEIGTTALCNWPKADHTCEMSLAFYPSCTGKEGCQLPFSATKDKNSIIDDFFYIFKYEPL